MKRYWQILINVSNRNPFDILGAVSQGIRAIWVDRARKGWVDSLLPVPAHLINLDKRLKSIMTVNDLDEISDTLASLA